MPCNAPRVLCSRALVGEELCLQQEHYNIHDCFAVTLMKGSLRKKSLNKVQLLCITLFNRAHVSMIIIAHLYNSNVLYA